MQKWLQFDLNLDKVHTFLVRERERDFIFRQLDPGVGIWRLPQVQHVAPSTGRLSYRPAAFLSMVQSIVYIGLSWLSNRFVNPLPYSYLMRHPLPLLQPYQNFYNAGETALSREPTLQRLLLLRGCLVPPLGRVPLHGHMYLAGHGSHDRKVVLIQTLAFCTIRSLRINTCSGLAYLDNNISLANSNGEPYSITSYTGSCW